MDIVTHAVTGAFSGAVFGRPVLGAFCAVVPDLCLGLERVDQPPKNYIRTHSLLFAGLLSLVLYLLLGKQAALCGAVAVVSHLFLDLPTHGEQWAPRLFYPIWNQPFSYTRSGEWEWFNDVWLEGLALAIVWCTVFGALIPL